METPNTVFMLKAIPAFYPGTFKKQWANAQEWKKKRNWYSLNTNGNNYLVYVSSHCVLDNENVDLQIKAEKKSGYDNYIDYASNRCGSTGLILANDNIATKDNVKKVVKMFQETNSCIWDGVLSFKELFGIETAMISKAKATEVLTYVLPKFFQEAGFSPKNINWYAAFHANTDNPHMHISFHEIEPQYYNRKTRQYEFTKKYKIHPNALDIIKFHAEMYLLDSRETFNEIRAIKKAIIGVVTWNEYKNHYQKERTGVSPEIAQMIIKLAKMLPNKGRIQYNAKNCVNLKNQINTITSKIIQQNQIANNLFGQFKTVLNKHQNLINQHIKQLKGKNWNFNKDIKKTLEFTNNQLYHDPKSLFAIIGQKVIKEALNIKNGQTILTKNKSNYIFMPKNIILEQEYQSTLKKLKLKNLINKMWKDISIQEQMAQFNFAQLNKTINNINYQRRR